MEIHEFEGWIKLPRSILHHSVNKDRTLFWVYCQLLLRAAHKPRIHSVGAREISLKTGQVFLSQRAFSIASKISRTTLRNCLRALEVDGLIETSDFGGGTLVQIQFLRSNEQRVKGGSENWPTGQPLVQSGPEFSESGPEIRESGPASDPHNKKGEGRSEETQQVVGPGRILPDAAGDTPAPRSPLSPQPEFSGGLTDQEFFAGASENAGDFEVDEFDVGTLDDVETLPEPADLLNDWVFGLIYYSNTMLLEVGLAGSSLVNLKNKGEMGRVTKLIKGAIKTIMEMEKCTQREAVWRILTVYGMMHNDWIERRQVVPLLQNACSRGFLASYLPKVPKEHFQNPVDFPMDSRNFYDEFKSCFDEIQALTADPKDAYLSGDEVEKSNLYNTQQSFKLSKSPDDEPSLAME